LRQNSFEKKRAVDLSKNSTPDLAYSLPATPVLGWLSRKDFDRARLRWPRFAMWGDYGEYLAERDALHLGYCCSGVTAEIQRVTLDAFERWARLTGAPYDLDGLDVFAAHWRWRAHHPGAPIAGRFGLADDPERDPVAPAGVERVLILPALYLRWRDGYARAKLFAPPDLDTYAAHVVECCLPSGKRARRRAANSA
jgi:hypothetical protein